MSETHATNPASAPEGVVTDADLASIDAWWRAANYLSAGQIYLLNDPLLRRPLVPEDVKPRLLGHWGGTTPGLNFLYAHLNRVIRDRSLSSIFVTGPGHGGPPGMVANATWTAPTPRCTRTSGATRTACGRCSASSRSPGGIPSHVAPETPGVHP